MAFWGNKFLCIACARREAIKVTEAKHYHVANWLNPGNLARILYENYGIVTRTQNCKSLGKTKFLH